MTIILTLLALAALGTGGWGVALVRSVRRPPAPGARAWLQTLRHGRRALGASLAAGAVLVLVVVLMVRP